MQGTSDWVAQFELPSKHGLPKALCNFIAKIQKGSPIQSRL
jgi:hypothetical protein